MDASQIIDKLKEDHGLSEYAIAKRLNAAGCKVSQSTINRIATGETGNPSYRVWRALEAFLADTVRSRTSKRATPAHCN